MHNRHISICIKMIWVLILIFSVSYFSIGQDNVIRDSLIEIINNSSNDSVKINALHSITQPKINKGTDQIINYAQQALELSRKTKWEEKEALSLMLLGNAYHEKGDYPKSIDYYWEAVRIFEKIGSKNLYARTLTNIASIYNYETSYKKALETFQKALDIAREIKDEQMESGILLNMGSSYIRAGDTAQAVIYTREASDLALKTANFRNLQYSYNNLSVIYAGKKEYDKAISLQRKILNYADTTDNYLMSLAFINLASLYREKKDFDSALYFAHQALDASEQHGSESRIAQVYESLFTLYMAAGDSAEALKYYLKADEIKNDLFNQENSRKIMELTQQYENEKALLRMARMKLIRQFFIVFSIVLLAFLVWVFVQYKRVKRQNVLLTQKSLKEARFEEEIDETDQKVLLRPAAAATTEAYAETAEKETHDGQFEDDNANLDRVLKELKRQMRSEKLFLDPALNLEKLGRSIGTNRTYLSQCINQNYGGFNSYINKLRINEFIRRASKKKSGSFTIEELAMACGFASISPFRAAFKKNTGLSPKVFISNLENEKYTGNNL